MAVASVTHNGIRIPFDGLQVTSGACSACIVYGVPPAAQHDVRVVLSFIGDTRRQLSLACFIDDELQSPVVELPHAEHRWEVNVCWRPTAEPRGDRSPKH